MRILAPRVALLASRLTSLRCSLGLSCSRRAIASVRAKRDHRGHIRIQPVVLNRQSHYPARHQNEPGPVTRQPARRPEAPSPPATLAKAHHIQPMLCTVDVVSTPTADSPGSAVWLHCDNRRYLFGQISEGTQRTLTEYGQSLAKLEDIMITGPINTHTCSGLLGLLLTVASVKGQQPVSTRIRVRGGRNLPYFLAMARKFIMRQNHPVDVSEILADPRLNDQSSQEPDWEDENINVWHVPLTPETFHSDGRKRRKISRDADATDEPSSSPENQTKTLSESDRELISNILKHMFESDWSLDKLVETPLSKVKLPATIFIRKDGKLEKYQGPLPGSGTEVPDIPVLVRTPWPASQIHHLPPSSPSTTSMCYIVKTHPQRGKFDPKAAQKLGVVGKDRGLLTKGATIVTKDGVTVTPDMVLSAPVPGSGFAVLDVPSSEYVDSLIARPEWSMEKIISNVKVIYWALGSGLLEDERIISFMKTHSEIRHTIISTDVCANHLVFEKSTSNIVRHNVVDSDRYPLVTYTNASPMADVSHLPIVPAQFKARLQLAPVVMFQDNTTRRIALDLSIPLSVQSLIDSARNRLEDPELQERVRLDKQHIPCPDVEITALGTGSSAPSPYRNVSATLVRVPGSGSYLFDCGEGTIGQLRRHYGFEGANEILRELRVVFLSHPHADHHLGTMSLIRAWDAVTSSTPSSVSGQGLPKLAVVSAYQLLNYIEGYKSVEHVSERIKLVNVPWSRSKSICDSVKFSAEDSAAFGGLSQVDCAAVNHCFQSLATVFTWKDTGLKVAFSGDCRPSDAFAEIGQGATLLIHEATFDNDMAGDAQAKRHSTIGEALDVARRMKARRVLLTHFSQRYCKVPLDIIPGGDSGSEKKSVEEEMLVLLASDHMRVKLGEFRQAAEYLPALLKLNAAEEGLGEDGQTKGTE